MNHTYRINHHHRMYHGDLMPSRGIRVTESIQSIFALFKAFLANEVVRGFLEFVIVFVVVACSGVSACTILADVLFREINLFPDFATGLTNVIYITTTVGIFFFVIWGMMRLSRNYVGFLMGIMLAGCSVIASVVFVIVPYVPM